jgi:hypothetical protein
MYDSVPGPHFHHFCTKKLIAEGHFWTAWKDSMIRARSSQMYDSVPGHDFARFYTKKLIAEDHFLTACRDSVIRAR